MVLQNTHKNELGDIVFVELPETDDELNEGDTFGSVESVKQYQSCMRQFLGKLLKLMKNWKIAQNL